MYKQKDHNHDSCGIVPFKDNRKTGVSTYTEPLKFVHLFL